MLESKRLMRGLTAAFAVAFCATTAHAEIAVLTNGMTLKVASRRAEGETLFLSLKDGGEVGVPVDLVRGFVPDEALDEIPAAASPTDLRALATETARRHGLDPDLVLAVISVESAFHPDAISPKGAQGLMQLMPGTAVSLGVRDALDPAENLDGGVRHLGSLVSEYRGDLRLALAAYNAGAGAVKRHGGVPPYRETRDYVDRVLGRYQRR
jgi:hypothetical protein